MSNIHLSHLGCVLFLLATTSLALAQTREEKVRGDRQRVESEGFWIYNDLDKAFQQARDTDKPLLVVLRCIPCEECVKLDDDLVDQNPKLRPLLEQFVRARQVSTNGLDLNLFQFDTDQSFAVFMLNADGTIYGRFGTRSHRTEWLGDVSVDGLAETLAATLQLHRRSAAERQALAGKRGEPLEVARPELYPSLKDKYSDQLNYSGDVVKSCIHCHQIGDARRSWYRDRGQPIPEQLLFPYPHPKSIGLVLDPDTRATVKQVEPDSPAAAAGLRAGDQIVRINKQPILSIADVQWVLQQTDPAGDTLQVSLARSAADGTASNATSTLTLAKGWRQKDDISWRVSSWGLRRMVTGGMVLEAADQAIRQDLQIADGQMALLVKRVGQYGPHAAAKRAGFRVDDVILSVDGKTELMTETQLFQYGTQEAKPGDKLSVQLVRNGQRKTLQLPMQN